jgi:hypothetical protein
MADNEDDLVDYDEEEVRKMEDFASLSDVLGNFRWMLFYSRFSRWAPPLYYR